MTLKTKLQRITGPSRGGRSVFSFSVPRTIGLIGYGRFGQLAARYLSRYVKVLVYDRRSRVLTRRRRRIQSASLAEVASQQVVVLAVPISAMRSTLRSLRRHLRPDALLVDVCTVKVKPLRWMKESLPSSVHILGTHPLFGPDSDRGTLRGQHIVLCPVRVPLAVFRRIRKFLSGEGIRISVMTPSGHDRMIAETILLTHYVGRFVHYAGIRRWPRSTASYHHLLSIVEVATSDTLQLLRDVWRYNPYTQHLAASLTRSRRRLRVLLR